MKREVGALQNTDVSAVYLGSRGIRGKCSQQLFWELHFFFFFSTFKAAINQADVKKESTAGLEREAAAPAVFLSFFFVGMKTGNLQRIKISAEQQIRKSARLALR